MLAARRSGERRYSLRAQAAAHLGTALDKGEQQSDWSRRPLTPRQLHYAGMDAASTLLLYEHQLARGLTGEYRLRDAPEQTQEVLPLDDAPLRSTGDSVAPHAVADARASPKEVVSPYRACATRGGDRVSGSLQPRTLGGGGGRRARRAGRMNHRPDDRGRRGHRRRDGETLDHRVMRTRVDRD